MHFSLDGNRFVTKQRKWSGWRFTKLTNITRKCWGFSVLHQKTLDYQTKNNHLKGIVMQIEKALISDGLRVSKVSWKFSILIIYNFAVIDPWNLLFSQKAAYFSTVHIVFSCL